MNRTVRKNAVLAIEVVLSYSDAHNKNSAVDVDVWKKDCVKFLNEQFNVPGGETNNVISAILHNDENEGPHIHAIVVPISDRDELNSQYYIGGAKKIRNIQTNYANAVGKNNPLSRGNMHSVAKHEDIKKWYTKLNSALYEEPPALEPGESGTSYQKKVKEFVSKKNLAHMQENADIQKKNNDLSAELARLRHQMYENEKKDKKREKKIREIISAAAKIKSDDNATLSDALKYVKSYGYLTRGLTEMKDRNRSDQITSDINEVMMEQRKIEKGTER